MLLFETAKFKKQREMLAAGPEKEALIQAILDLQVDPATADKLQGDLAGLRCFHYLAAGQQKKLIYKPSADTLILLSFGPWVHTSKS